jgi:copper chaperone CopZ
MSNQDSASAAPQITSATFAVHGMTCDHCSRRVEKALRSLDGVRDVTMNRIAGAATVSFDSTKLDLGRLREAVIKSGFKSPVS